MDESNIDNLDDATEDFSPAEDVDSSTIIVIHPGSRFLRIGLASDPAPKKLLHAIARKRKNNNPAYNRVDPFVIPKVNESLLLFLIEYEYAISFSTFSCSQACF
jgi:actin-related protein 8